MLKKEKSEMLSKEFNKYYPGGHSNLRIPMDVTEHRLFIAKSQGTHLTDVDGNKYIEYNIFKSVENININQVMGYYDYDKRHNYYDDYDK